MQNKESALKLLLKDKLLPLYYHDSLEVSLNIMKALYKAGIRMIEYTARGTHALENFAALKKEITEITPGLMLGAGTIKSVVQASLYINAGADFIVCPIIKKEIGKEVDKAGLLWIPGCMTPTEIAIAEEMEAGIVKIFPGNLLGPSFVSSVKELFPSLLFMPTGGVEPREENLKAWFQSGIAAVGIGSKLISKELIEKKEYDLLRTNTSEVLTLIRKVTMT